jgi:cytochrome c oxidase subunit 2
LHAKHTGTLVVLERDEYDNWLAGLFPKEPVADGTLAWNGRKLFLKNQCLTCHSAEAQAKGPNLEGLWGKAVPLKDGGMVRVDEQYIRESILRPRAKVVEGWEPIMPAFDKEKISEEEMIALIAYIKSLKPGDTPKRTEKIPPPVGAPTEKKQPKS